MAVLEEIEKITSKGNKVVVFTQWHKILDYL